MKQVLSIFLLLLFFVPACKKENELTSSKTADLKMVTIGLQNNCAVAMLLIAKANGYFKEQGLNVEFKFYPSGKLAYKGMLAGEVNYSTVADMPIASHGVNVDARIITSFATTRK